MRYAWVFIFGYFILKEFLTFISGSPTLLSFPNGGKKEQTDTLTFRNRPFHLLSISDHNVRPDGEDIIGTLSLKKLEIEE